MENFLKRTWAEVHLDRLASNARAVRAKLAPGCRIMGIVKADAYGHGAVESAKTLSKAGVDWFGVSNLEEGIQLRRAGVEEPIMVISYTPPAEVKRLAEYRITQAVVSLDHAKALSSAAVAAGVTLSVHITVDTGMSRVGFVCHGEEDAPSAAAEIVSACALPGLRAEGIFTHFASADEPDGEVFTRHQFGMFTAVIDRCAAEGVTFSLRHCCNSPATLRFPEMHLDMVRPGIILYGLTPDDWMGEMMPEFRPVLELKTAVSEVKIIPANTPISYGRTYVTARPTTVATVPIGYADGYFRRMYKDASMLIDGHRVPVIGRICMDQCMLDVTGLDVTPGTEVTVIGKSGDGFISAEEVAKKADTVNYEVVCAISKRVPRLFLDGENPVGQLDYLLP